MKINRSDISARVLAGIPFLVISISLLALAWSSANAGNRVRKGIQPAWTQPSLVTPIAFNGTYDPFVYPCATARHHFTVPAGQVRIVVQVNAQIPTNDLTMSLLFGPDPSPILLHTEDTGTSNEVYQYAPAGGVPAGEYQVQICQTPSPNGVPQMAPYTYSGNFTYDDTLPGGTPPVFGTLPPAPQDAGAKVGYENCQPPGVLTPVTVTSSGGKTVEYLGRNGIEPSIGSNFNTGIAVYQCDLETLFIDFTNGCGANGVNATWTNRPAPLSVFVDSDPIGFTDRQTGRTFISELTLLSPNTAKNAHTDNDGVSWVVDQSGGFVTAVDHQTIGGGPYHAPIPSKPPGVYPNAVYYCSQNLGADAQCARSDDGGVTYGPSIPIYTEATCGGLHGHLKVAPDGTVYVPNKGCGGIQSVVVSEDNGITWTPRAVKTDTVAAAPATVGTGDDPALGIDDAGRLYFVFSNFGTSPGVAISDDHGQTWKNMFDVGAVYGLKNVCFPTAVGGSAGRAAVAFYGSSTPNDTVLNGRPTGNSNEADFTGVWHLYIAHTFDGGKTWTTSDATPTLPMQRSGLLRGGGADIVRNLADFFDMTIDRDGRVLVGYGNGCDGGPCGQAPLNADGTTAVKGNAYSATAAIARQSSGRRMLAAKDPASNTSVPGMPSLSQTRKGNVVRLVWNEADTGNSPITGYQINRGTAPGQEAFLTTVAGNQIGGSFDDTTANDPTKTYYYTVAAINSVGTSCSNNEIAAPYMGDTCTGLIIHRNDPTHPESTGGTVAQPPIPQLLIDYIAVGEPPSTNDLMFKMKVGNLNGPLPPNSRWRIAWNYFVPGTGGADDIQMWYIGMNTDENSAVTFEYGTLADAGVPALLVLGEFKVADIPQSAGGTHYDADGTITMYVPKSGVGNPQIGDLLGAIGGKTITGDTPASRTFQRSTAFVDHTFIKGQSDNAFPSATYSIVGNTVCSAGTIVPVSAVSRKTHGNAGDFDIDLPLIGSPGIEDRRQGNTGNHRVIITFAAPVTVVDATVIPGAGKSAGRSGSGAPTVNGSQVTVDLTGVDNAQTLSIKLVGVSDGLHNGDVSIPMSVLAADTTGDGFVNSADISQTKSQSGNEVTNANFREDVTADGFVNSADIALAKAMSGTGLQ